MSENQWNTYLDLELQQQITLIKKKKGITKTHIANEAIRDWIKKNIGDWNGTRI